MTVREFFNRVKKSLEETESYSDPAGAEFFISDMDELFEEWEEQRDKN